ncbi:GntR family transcriptional regulator, arabinose operon transcriptional repressor [Pseudobutyrivibrio ruminis]|uniref:GntR family transcriptional regulator, arabinose operon transcriptional repressor n=1 Tax=Pseudobutyrivibrio ruminis TaxID=46206 RepID=A0A1H7LMT6_9FIRM|nr:GntR family transcriptional regulator [Pseudobutyrivibrio ruminis]SEK99687.1 GntR family transcriptional regulator, arabinose operon transcriptional repressor [Pseudobutyrivibrio ruminis]
MIPKYISLKNKLNNDILENKYPIGSKLPTEVELAKEYKVSRSTVRQALDLLVEQGIIDKHWGSGNTVIAKSDNSKSKTVMVLLPNNKDAVFTDVFSDISSMLMKNGFEVEFHSTQNSYQLERQYLQLLMNDIYAGLIIMMARSNFPSTNVDLLQLQCKRQLPIVFIDTAPSAIYNPVIISTDNYGRGYQMARHLINRGHKKLGGIFVNDNYSSIQAFSGFTDAIRDANLEIMDNSFHFCNYHDPQGVNSRTNAGINRFLKYAYDTVSAVYVDDPNITGDGTFPIFTSSLTPSKSLGRECANAIMEIKKNGNSKSVTIPFKAN